MDFCIRRSATTRFDAVSLNPQPPPPYPNPMRWSAALFAQSRFIIVVGG